jgi:hypothetical protein
LRWASEIISGLVGRVEPNDGKKDAGFVDGEAPPAGEHNWLFGLAGDWVTYLDEQVTALLERAAFEDEANIFAEPNAFARGLLVSPTSSAEAALLVDVLPGAHPGYPANAWKLIFEFAADDPVHLNQIRVYSGANDSDAKGAFSIVTNAEWNIAGSTWQQIDPVKLSSAVIWHYGKLRVVTMRAGSAPWPHWDSYPTSSPYDPLIDGAVVMTSALTAYALTTLGDAAVGNDLGVAHAVRAESFAYHAPQSRITNIPLWSGMGIISPITLIALPRTGEFPVWPIRLPVGAVVHELEAIVRQQTASASSLTPVVRVTNWSTLLGNDLTGLTTDSGHAGSGLKLYTANFNGYVVTGAEDLFVLWQPADAADEMHALRVHWTAPGPA